MNQKIDLMIIGAQKAGTTSLHKYLCEHPEVEGHFTIEYSYFLIEDEYQKGFNHSLNTFFDLKDKNPKALVAKSALLSINEIGLSKLYKHNKDVTIVFMIREPVERAFSSFNFEKMNGGMQGKSFDDIGKSIAAYDEEGVEDSMYRILIKLGLYSDHLEKVYKYFPKEQVQIVLFEEFKQQPNRICKSLFQKLDVDDGFVPNINSTHNKTKVVKSKWFAEFLLNLRTKNKWIKDIVKSIMPYKKFNRLKNHILNWNKTEGRYPEMSVETREFLQAFFRPYNQKLIKIYKTNLNAWYKN